MRLPSFPPSIPTDQFPIISCDKAQLITKVKKIVWFPLQLLKQKLLGSLRDEILIAEGHHFCLTYIAILW